MYNRKTRNKNDYFQEKINQIYAFKSNTLERKVILMNIQIEDFHVQIQLFEQ